MTLRRYEAMFLFDSAVTRDWATVEQEVRRLLERIGAELLVCVKFDERRLAYEINRRKRGLYVLTYIDADSDRIVDLERDVQLSELVLRILVLRAENLTEERLAELKAHPPETALAPQSEGRGRHDDGPGGRPPRPGRGDRGDRSDRDGDRPAPRERQESAGPPQPAPAGGTESAATATADAPPTDKPAEPSEGDA
jgi:small subunit ribosomal protein S6